MKRRRDTGGGGFTIIEVIVAIGIVTIGLLGTLPMLTYSIKSNIVAKNRGIALYLADRQIEKIKSWPAYVFMPDQLDAGAGVQGVAMANQMFGEGGAAGWDWNCGGDCTNCCREYNVQLNWWDTKFNRTTWIIRNGYTSVAGGQSYSSYDCSAGGGVTFLPGGTGTKNFDEGPIYASVQNGANSYFGTDKLRYLNVAEQGWPSLNHYSRNLEYDGACTGATKYRGEDFVLVRVEVTWSDIFSQGGKHSIVRNAYIRGH